jgi:hypothetical protein
MDAVPASDPRKVMSSTYGKTPPIVKFQETGQDKKVVFIDGNKYRKVDVHRRFYEVSRRTRKQRGGMVDRGANGIVSGNDVRVIEFVDGPPVDVGGIDAHRINNVPLATVGAVMDSSIGPIIGIFYQAAHHGKGRTILSSPQLEAFGNIVGDKSIKVGGSQRITTPDGLVIPIDIVDNLPYTPMRSYTDAEWENLPHVLFTKDVWDPTELDCVISDKEDWYNVIPSTQVDYTTNIFDIRGNYKLRTIAKIELELETDANDARDNDDFVHENSKGLILGSEKYVADTHNGPFKDDGPGRASNRKVYQTTWGENYDDDVEYNLVDELYKVIPHTESEQAALTNRQPGECDPASRSVNKNNMFHAKTEKETSADVGKGKKVKPKPTDTIMTGDPSKETQERGVCKVPSNASGRQSEADNPSIPMVGGLIDKTPWNGELVKGDLPTMAMAPGDLPKMDMAPKNKVRKKDSALTNGKYGESVEWNSPAIDLMTNTKNGSALNDNASQTTCRELYLADQIVLPSNKSRGAMSELMPCKTSWDVDSCYKSPMAGLMASEERQDDNPASDDDSDHGMHGKIYRKENGHDLDDQMEQSHGYAMAEKMQTGVIQTIEVAEEFTILADDTNDPKIWLALGLKWMDQHLDNVYDGENAMGFTTPMQDNIRKATRVTSGEETMNPGVKDVSTAKFHTAKFHASETETTERHGEIPHGETELERHGEIPHGEITAPETETTETHGEIPHGETETTERQREIPHGEITEKHEETTHGETMSVSQFYRSDTAGWMFPVKKQEGVPRFCVRTVEETEQRENERPSCWNTMIEWEPGEACRSPLKRGDHPNMDTTKSLEDDDVQMYLSLIRSETSDVLSKHWGYSQVWPLLSEQEEQEEQEG